MIPYYAVLLFAFLISLLARNENSRALRSISFLLLVILLCSFAALRDQSVGSDTSNYVLYFNLYDDFSAISQYSLEYGYGLFNVLIRKLSNDSSVLFAAIAMSVLVPTLVTIYRGTGRVDIAIFVFIAMGFYTFSFNGARQGIAAAITFSALPFLFQRKNLYFFCFVIFAASFHKSALLFFLLYFFKNLNSLRSMLIANSCFLLVLMLSSSTLMRLIGEMDDRYSSYGLKGDGGGGVYVTFLVALAVFFSWILSRIKYYNDQYKFLLNVYLIGVAISIFAVLSSVNPSGLLRFSYYFTYSSILIWPLIFLNLAGGIRQAVFGFFLIFYVIYFGLTTSSFGSLVPYVFAWQF